MSSETSGRWYIPPIVVQLADGSTLVKPGKAILRATSTETEALTGISTRSLRQLAQCGLIRSAQPIPGKVFYYPQEVHDLIARTETEPGFWDHVKRQAYLSGTRLQDANAQGMATAACASKNDQTASSPSP